MTCGRSERGSPGSVAREARGDFGRARKFLDALQMRLMPRECHAQGDNHDAPLGHCRAMRPLPFAFAALAPS